MAKEISAITSAPHLTSARLEKKLPTASTKRVMSLPSEAVITAPRVRPRSEPEGPVHARVRERWGHDIGVERHAVERRHPDDEHARGPRGGHAGVRVLQCGATLRRHPEAPRGL